VSQSRRLEPGASIEYFGFEVLRMVIIKRVLSLFRMVIIKSTVFGDVMLCSLVKPYPTFQINVLLPSSGSESEPRK
jgi:hypothetical protein